MKTFRLFLFAYILCSFNPLLAQQDFGYAFLFPDFEKGNVIFKNGLRSSAMFNYSMLNQEMLFLDEEKNILTIANPSEVYAVVIGERQFFPISSKGIFYEKIQVENGSFFTRHNAKINSEGKNSGYGGYDQTSAISSFSSLRDYASGSYYDLTVNEKFSLIFDNFYYLQFGQSYKRFSSAKSLAKLFKGQGSKIEAFAKKESINFTNIEDVRKIVAYGFSLTNK